MDGLGGSQQKVWVKKAMRYAEEAQKKMHTEAAVGNVSIENVPQNAALLYNDCDCDCDCDYEYLRQRQHYQHCPRQPKEKEEEEEEEEEWVGGGSRRTRDGPETETLPHH